MHFFWSGGVSLKSLWLKVETIMIRKSGKGVFFLLHPSRKNSFICHFEIYNKNSFISIKKILTHTLPTFYLTLSYFINLSFKSLTSLNEIIFCGLMNINKSKWKKKYWLWMRCMYEFCSFQRRGWWICLLILKTGCTIFNTLGPKCRFSPIKP